MANKRKPMNERGEHKGRKEHEGIGYEKMCFYIYEVLLEAQMVIDQIFNFQSFIKTYPTKQQIYSKHPEGLFCPLDSIQQIYLQRKGLDPVFCLSAKDKITEIIKKSLQFKRDSKIKKGKMCYLPLLPFVTWNL